jgi:hypothetical protein
MPFSDGIMLFIVFIFVGVLIYKMIKTYKDENL